MTKSDSAAAMAAIIANNKPGPKTAAPTPPAPPPQAAELEVAAGPTEPEAAEPAPEARQTVARRSLRQQKSIRGKRAKAEYVQANAYVLKRVRRAVEKELVDLDHVDFSGLVEHLLLKWLKDRGIEVQ